MQAIHGERGACLSFHREDREQAVEQLYEATEFEGLAVIAVPQRESPPRNSWSLVVEWGLAADFARSAGRESGGGEKGGPRCCASRARHGHLHGHRALLQPPQGAASLIEEIDCDTQHKKFCPDLLRAGASSSARRRSSSAPGGPTSSC